MEHGVQEFRQNKKFQEETVGPTANIADYADNLRNHRADEDPFPPVETNCCVQKTNQQSQMLQW